MKLIKDMDEPSLREYFSLVMEATLSVTPPDVDWLMVVMHTDQGISQYVASKKMHGVPEALRELADRIEKGDTIER